MLFKRHTRAKKPKIQKMQNGNIIALNGHSKHATAINNTTATTPTSQPNLNEEKKIEMISGHFAQIMQLLGLNIEDDSLKGTPARVASMLVRETCSGLNPANKPDLTLFENSYHYHQMLVEKNITVYSTCEHHFVPIIGKAHVAYFPSGKVIGLSKINRIVQYHASRPQVQERLTEEIAAALKEALQTNDVAVVVDAVHLCVAMRGVCDVNSSTITSHYSGKFNDDAQRKAFLTLLK
jgi:GTP cyclohydrolase IA